MIKTPSETMRTPEYNKADKIFNDYKKMLRENKAPKELLVFLNKNIRKLHESSADIAVVRVIELQKDLLTKYEKKLLEPVYAKQVENIETKEIHDITDDKVRELVMEIEDNGLEIKHNKKVVINYAKISKIANDCVSNELKDYIKIESDESNKENIDDFLNRNTDQINDFVMKLAKMLNGTYDYIYSHSDSPYIMRVKELQSEYLQIFFFGSPNNSSFTYYQGSGIPNNKILPKWNEAYLNVKNTYTKKYGFGVFMGNYYNELSKYGYVLTRELYDYMYKKISNQDM